MKKNQILYNFLVCFTNILRRIFYSSNTDNLSNEFHSKNSFTYELGKTTSPRKNSITVSEPFTNQDKKKQIIAPRQMQSHSDDVYKLLPTFTAVDSKKSDSPYFHSAAVDNQMTLNRNI